MKLKMKTTLLVIATMLFTGCSHYEQTVALGAIAGGATGALIADQTYTPHYGYGYGHGYGYHGNTSYGHPIHYGGYDNYGGYYPNRRYTLDGRSWEGVERPVRP